jgi:hypothetical protein
MDLGDWDISDLVNSQAASAIPKVIGLASFSPM